MGMNLLSAVLNFLNDHHNALESLAAIATVFALLVPLPIFVFSTSQKRRADARDRAYALIERMQSEEYSSLNSSLNDLHQQGKLTGPIEFDGFSKDEMKDLLSFLNLMEFISMHLNNSRIEKRIFYRMYRSMFIENWEIIRPIVLAARQRSRNPRYFCEFEVAINDAKSQAKAELHRDWHLHMPRSRR